MKRISRRALDLAEVRRQQAEDDKRIAAWRASQAPDHPLLREWLGLDAPVVDGDDGYWRTPGLEDLECAYWDLIQWGFAKDRRGRAYDRYADNPANHGPDREYDDQWYDDEDAWDDDSGGRWNDYGDPFGLGDAYDWHAAYHMHLDYADNTAESYREWFDAKPSPTGGGDDDDAAVGKDETARSSIRNMTKGLVPDTRGAKLRMLARRQSRSWKDVTDVAKPWMRKAS